MLGCIQLREEGFGSLVTLAHKGKAKSCLVNGSHCCARGIPSFAAQQDNSNKWWMAACLTIHHEIGRAT